MVVSRVWSCSRRFWLHDLHTIEAQAVTTINAPARTQCLHSLRNTSSPIRDTCDLSVLVRGRGGRCQTIPLHPVLEGEIRGIAWFHPTWPVAGTLDNKPLRPQSVARIFGRWLPKRGMRLHLYTLRRTFATQLYRNGASIWVIQVLLGVRCRTITIRFLGVGLEGFEDSIKKLPSHW